MIDSLDWRALEIIGVSLLTSERMNLNPTEGQGLAKDHLWARALTSVCPWESQCSVIGTRNMESAWWVCCPHSGNYLHSLCLTLSWLWGGLNELISIMCLKQWLVFIMCYINCNCYTILFFNPHSRVCLLIWAKEWERERGRERDVREKHWCERETLINCLPYAPRLGIKPKTFWCMGPRSNKMSHPARATILFYSMIKT